MISEAFIYEDELPEETITVLVETAHVYRVPKAKNGPKGLYLYMDTEHATHTTSAYIPRKQAKKIIKAMKEALNEE